MPPKLRPALPPKQTIDKSREDLAQIDLKFKSSLVELRSRSGCKQFHVAYCHDLCGTSSSYPKPFRPGEEDYDDLPAEADVPAIPAKKHRRQQRALGSTNEDSAAAGGGVGSREFEDYDDPIRQHCHPMENTGLH